MQNGGSFEGDKFPPRVMSWNPSVESEEERLVEQVVQVMGKTPESKEDVEGI